MRSQSNFFRLVIFVILTMLTFMTVGCGGGGGSHESGQVAKTVKIGGYLFDENGKPLANATIKFSSDPVITTTDANGYWEAYVLPGLHEVAIMGTGSPYAIATLEMYVANFVEVHWKEGSKVIFIINPFAEDIAGQGVSPTEAIVGNSSMVAGLTKEGRLATFYFPYVGAYNHIPYYTSDDKSSLYYGAEAFEGSFAGLRIGDDFSWLMDTTEWEITKYGYEKDEKSGNQTSILNIVYSHKSKPVTVKETIFVPSSLNILVRHFGIENKTGKNINLIYYGRFNINKYNHYFAMWFHSKNKVEFANNTIIWADKNSPYEVRIAVTTDDNKIMAMKGGVIDWDGKAYNQANISPQGFSNAVEHDGLGAFYPISAFAEWELGTITNKELNIVIATGDDVLTSKQRLNNYISAGGFKSLKERTIEWWNNWLSKSVYPSNISSSDKDLYQRWLISLKMLADSKTGGIIASPNLQPQYYGSWPRDGVYQAVAHLMSGHREEAEAFFNWLFRKNILRDGNHWIQCYNILTGENVGLPEVLNNVEEDQMPTVLWGLWVYYKTQGRLPSSVTTEQIRAVADYILGRIDSNGLLYASLDWHEVPFKDPGQSLYTNAAAVAGLYAASELLSDPKYSQKANAIRNAITTQLCSGDDCKTGIYYYVVVDRGRGYNIMAMAWPFHLYELDDIKVKNYYEKVHSQIQPSDSTTAIFAYLFSYLYELEALNNPEVGEGEFKETVKKNASVRKGILRAREKPLTPDETSFITFVGYQKEQVGRVGALPLGWSQAFGVLSLLAESGIRVPLIDTGVSTTIDDEIYNAEFSGRIITIYNKNGYKLWDFTAGSNITTVLVADVNDDNSNEVVFGTDRDGTDKGVVYVLNKRKEVLWTYKTGKTGVFWPDDQMPVVTIRVADVDNDGTKEIVTLSYHYYWYPERLCVLNAKTGELEGDYWNPGRGTSSSSLVIDDLDNDGIIEIIVGSGNNDMDNVAVVYCLKGNNVAGQAPPYYGNAPKGTQIWYSNLGKPINEIYPYVSWVRTVSDMTGDGIKDLKCGRGTEDNPIYVIYLDGKTGNIIKREK